MHLTCFFATFLFSDLYVANCSLRLGMLLSPLLDLAHFSVLLAMMLSAPVVGFAFVPTVGFALLPAVGFALWPALAMLFLFVPLDVLRVDARAYHLLEPSLNSSLTSCLRSSARDIDAGSAVVAHGVRLVTKSLRVRSVLVVSKAHIVARVMTPVNVALTSSCSCSASGLQSPPRFLVVCGRHCFWAWCLMVKSAPSTHLNCTDRPASETCGAISSV